MTKMTYDVISRPKKNDSGLTKISWAAECGRDAVAYGGYLITKRTPKGEKKKYVAVVIETDSEGNRGDERTVGVDFTSRAQAAFAIWREYYGDLRSQKSFERDRADAEKENRAIKRKEVRVYRETPEGKGAYRMELNHRAKLRRDNMTSEQKEALKAKRKAKAEA